MQIIKPLGNEVSCPVNTWSQIELQALELKEMVDNNKYTGNWSEAYAVAHVQVSRVPFAFFVVHKALINTFGHWCVVNMEIIKTADPILSKEGCMSFMYRKVKSVNRFNEVKVKYQIPDKNGKLIRKTKTFHSTTAIICQHETDHFKGINIYGL